MSNELALKCWSCKEEFTLKERADCDGCCWRCGVEIDLEDYAENFAGEAQRLRSMFDQTDADLRSVTAEIDILRAQIADRDALLTDISKRHWSGVDFDLPADLVDRIKALYASAEPSAPVELDAVEEMARLIYENWAGQPGYVPWVARGNSLKQDEARRKARAALERKPS